MMVKKIVDAHNGHPRQFSIINSSLSILLLDTTHAESLTGIVVEFT